MPSSLDRIADAISQGINYINPLAIEAKFGDKDMKAIFVVVTDLKDSQEMIKTCANKVTQLDPAQISEVQDRALKIEDIVHRIQETKQLPTRALCEELHNARQQLGELTTVVQETAVELGKETTGLTTDLDAYMKEMTARQDALQSALASVKKENNTLISESAVLRSQVRLAQKEILNADEKTQEYIDLSTTVIETQRNDITTLGDENDSLLITNQAQATEIKKLKLQLASSQKALREKPQEQEAEAVSSAKKESAKAIARELPKIDEKSGRKLYLGFTSTLKPQDKKLIVENKTTCLDKFTDYLKKDCKPIEIQQDKWEEQVEKAKNDPDSTILQQYGFENPNTFVENVSAYATQAPRRPDSPPPRLA